jgi:hypothetical protein
VTIDRGDGVEIASFRYLHEAELAAGYLEDAGIPAACLGDPAGQIQYGKGFSSKARLLVRGADLEEARAVLEDAGILEPSSEPGEPGPSG